MKIREFLTIFSALFLSMSFVIADAADGYGCGMMYGSYGAGGAFFGWLIFLLVIVALVLLIVWLVKQIQNTGKKR